MNRFRLLAISLLAAPALLAPSAHAADRAAVSVQDSVFVAPSVTVGLKGGKATVTWRWDTTSVRPHSVTSTDRKSFDSHPSCAGSAITMCGLTTTTSFSTTFTKPGKYYYFCKIHGGASTPGKPGSGMAGVVIVTAR